MILKFKVMLLPLTDRMIFYLKAIKIIEPSSGKDKNHFQYVLLRFKYIIKFKKEAQEYRWSTKLTPKFKVTSARNIVHLL